MALPLDACASIIPMSGNMDHFLQEFDQSSEETIDTAIRHVKDGVPLSLIEKRALEHESSARGGRFSADDPKQIEQLRLLLVLQDIGRSRASIAQNLVSEGLYASATVPQNGGTKGHRGRKNPYSNKFMPPTPGRRWNQKRW